jgi:hypothetical protein
MNPFVSFMVSTSGRITRVVAGALLIAWGLMGIGGAVGVLVAVIGVVPFAAGLFDFCVFAPLFGNPINGSKIRARGR